MRVCVSLLLLMWTLSASANITLPAVINNDMVLQQQSRVKLWGWSGPGEKVFVTTSWNNTTDSVKADCNAKWQLLVQTPAAGGPYTITFKGNNTITLSNVLIGEVWVCSGQSNMEMNFNWGLPQMREDFPTVANPNIRYFTMGRITSTTPQDDTRGSWSLCDSNTVKGFSAVAYYFARKLNAEMGVPVGLLHASWGGTPAEVWTPAEVVTSDSVLSKAALQLKQSNGWPRTPGYTYNAMIAPLTNFTIKGAIWYQGESNTGTAFTYRQLFTSMITAWRKQWDIDFPFYYVQLAPYAYGNHNIAALLREAQTQSLSLNKTGMVVTSDIGGDTTDIHPRDKRSVGYRLANLALLRTYTKPVTGADNPMYEDMSVRKDKVGITISYPMEELVIKDKNATGFYVAGSDRVFYPAQAKMERGEIVVWSKSVPNPVAVRYAFGNTASGSVFNRQGLPLAPFRTDNWEVDTSSVKK